MVSRHVVNSGSGPSDSTEPEGVAETQLPPQQESHQRPQQQDAHHAHRDPRAGQHGRENQRRHHQRRQVQRGRPLGYGDGGFHRGAAPFRKGGCYGDNARGTEVHGGPDGKAPQDSLDAAARNTRTSASGEQEYFRYACSEERENHPHRYQLQVAGGEVPPPFEEAGLRFPVDAKPLEALGPGSVDAGQVSLNRVQLGDPVEGQEQGKNDGQQQNADDPLLFQRRIKHRQSSVVGIALAGGPGRVALQFSWFNLPVIPAKSGIQKTLLDLGFHRDARMLCAPQIAVNGSPLSPTPGLVQTHLVTPYRSS